MTTAFIAGADLALTVVGNLTEYTDLDATREFIDNPGADADAPKGSMISPDGRDANPHRDR